MQTIIGASLNYRTVLSAVMVGIGVFLGAKLGLALSMPPSNIATLWLPNAFVLAALLLTEKRRWWVYFLVMTVPYLVGDLNAAHSVQRSLIFYTANCIEVFVAAFTLKYFIKERLKFDQLREIVLYLLLAVLIAPVISALIASTVTFVEPVVGYWLAWRAWFLGDALGHLTLTPVIILCVASYQAFSGRDWLKKISFVRLIESASLALCIFVVGYFSFGVEIDASNYFPALLYAPLPVLLWAAIRFGPGGGFSAIFVITLLAIWNAINNQGPFTANAPEDNVLSLQLFLFAISVPTMLLCSLLSERKHVHIKLKVSRKKYYGMLMNLMEGFCSVSWEGKVLEYNNETVKLLGFDTSKNYIGTELPDFWLNPEDREKYFDELKKSGFLRNYIINGKKLGGEKIVIQVNSLVVKDVEGVPLRIDSTFLDVTERVQAEEKLRKSEQRWSFALEGTGEGLWDWNLQTDEVIFSKRWKEMLGYEEDDIGNSMDERDKRVHPDDWKQTLEDVNKHLSGATTYYQNEHRVLCKDGHYKWILDRGKVVQWGKDRKPLRMIGLHMDITERKLVESKIRKAEKSARTARAETENLLLQSNKSRLVLLSILEDQKQTEERLKHSELQQRKLAQAVEQSAESIVITNINAKIEYINEAFISTTGYAREELIGKNPNILKSGKTPPENYKAMWNELSNGRAWKGEFYNKRKDGTEFIEFVRVTPIQQSDGAITHYVAVKEDITEKKRLAKELDEHRNHLEQMVVERTEQLEYARERAEVASQSKSAFLANMSHEIRTPMNAIIGLTHLMQRAEATPEQIKMLGKIDTAAGHLLSIINDILDISKIEAGKLTIEHSDFHLDVIFDYIQSMLKEQASAKGLTINIDKNDTPIWLRGDSTRVRQALLNYASNAIKFTEQGTITLRAKKLEENDDEIFIRFEVQDTGIGIDPDKLMGLFESFEQADVSTTREYGGTGLGLSITQHLANLMGGEVGAKSAPGVGSTFWFTALLTHGHGVMPANLSISVTDSEMVLRKHYAGTRILLVEDNDINREVATELLYSAALTVDIAENGQEAVEKIRTNVYDLVLMDVQMPVMDGLTATRLIRSMEGKSVMPILAMTANVFEDDRNACADAGMNGFVAKPFELDKFFSEILRWLPERENLEPEDIKSEILEQGNDELPVKVTTQNIANDAAEQNKLVFIEAIEGMETQIGLHNMRGDVVGYLRLLRQFETLHGDDMQKLNECLVKNENEEVRRIAHNLKGAAGTLGFKTLQLAASQLEDYISSHDDVDSDGISPLIDKVSFEQTKLHQALTRVNEHDEFKNTVKADPKAAQKVIEQLAKLLEKDDTVSNALFLKNEALLQSTFGAVAEKLGQQIETFDYLMALKTIKPLLA